MRFQTNWRHAASLAWLFACIATAISVGAQGPSNVGPSAYRNGFGIGDGAIPYTEPNTMCAEGSVCEATDFPLGGLGPASTLKPTATHTVYSTCIGPQWMAAAWAIDNSFGGTLAVAKTISANGAADSAQTVQSFDGTVIAFNTSFGGRGWFSTYNMSTGACTPLLEEGHNGFSFGGGVPEFAKMSIGGNGHIAYGYCVAPLNPGLCQIDPVTGIVTQLVDLNAIGNLPSDGPIAGTGGEVTCTRDLFGAGLPTMCNMSIGVSGEPENAWRYIIHIWMANLSSQWIDVKRDMTAYSTSPAFPGSPPPCLTAAVTHGLCYGIAAAPSSYVSSGAPLNCVGGTLAGCQGLHGVGIAVDYQNNIYTNASLEKNCTVSGCVTAGPTFYTAGVAPGCSTTEVITGLCATISTVLNGAGHRAAAGAGSVGLNAATIGNAPVIANFSPQVTAFVFQTIGRPSTDGHDSGVATDNIGSTSTNVNGHGMLGFGSFYNGTAFSSGIVCNGVTCNIGCSTTPCFYLSAVPETSVTISNLKPSDPCVALGGTWPISGSNNGTVTNTLVITAAIASCSTAASAIAVTATSCQDPVAPGMNTYIFYSIRQGDLDTSGNQRNAQIIHSYMDTCANNQNFFNLVNGNVNPQGTRLVLPTNRNCTIGTDNAGNCQRILEVVELLPLTTNTIPAPSPASFAGMISFGTFFGILVLGRKKKRHA